MNSLTVIIKFNIIGQITSGFVSGPIKDVGFRQVFQF